MGRKQSRVPGMAPEPKTEATQIPMPNEQVFYPNGSMILNKYPRDDGEIEYRLTFIVSPFKMITFSLDDGGIDAIIKLKSGVEIAKPGDVVGL